MDDEKLISLVKKFEHIYNKKSPGFKSAEKKEETWLIISKELGFPVETCLKRWTSLRDQYTRESREKLLPNGNEHFTNAKRWHLSKALDFLKPHIRFRPTSGPKKASETVAPSSPDTKYAETTEFVLPVSSLVWPEHENTEDSPPIEPIDFVDTFAYGKESSKRKRKTSDVDKAFCEAVSCFKKLCEKEESKKNRPFEAFGQMIVAVLDDMSVTKQNKAIKLVTEVLMKIKEQPE